MRPPNASRGMTKGPGPWRNPFQGDGMVHAQHRPHGVAKPVEEAKASAGTVPPPPLAPDSDAAAQVAETMDRATRAAMARATLGLSPAALIEAWSDWAIHLLTSPGKQAHLVEKWHRKQARLARYVLQCAMYPRRHAALHRALASGSQV